MATLYAGRAGYNDGLSDLYTVDLETGVLTSVGPSGFMIDGLAYDRTAGILYGITGSDAEDNPDSLITLNMNTGVGTLVGPLGYGIDDITCGDDGRMYGIGDDSVGPPEWNGAIYRIDKETGAATILVVWPAIYFGQPSYSAITFDRNGVLWGFGYSYLWAIDPEGLGGDILLMGDSSYLGSENPNNISNWETLGAATCSEDNILIVSSFDFYGTNLGISVADMPLTSAIPDTPEADPWFHPPIVPTYLGVDVENLDAIEWVWGATPEPDPPPAALPGIPQTFPFEIRPTRKR